MDLGELRKIMNPEVAKRVQMHDLNEDQQRAILEWGLEMFSSGQHLVADIDEVKYEGRLLILNDGSRWEVESIDADTSNLWDFGDKVVIIDGEMYKLDESEKVAVTED
jgi:hypothetical protein